MKIRQFLKDIAEIRTSLKEKKKYEEFNRSTENNIQSTKVHLDAIRGHNITMLDGSYACENTEIDSYTFIGFNSLISKTQIGRYNSIASNVNIGHGEHPLDLVSTSGFFIENTYDELTGKNCVIESDVWLGAGSIIRRGVTVGVGSVVGANSFVNKDVPPYAIVVGSPAKIIRYRFAQDQIERLLKSTWWKHELDDARKLIAELSKKQ